MALSSGVRLCFPVVPFPVFQMRSVFLQSAHRSTRCAHKPPMFSFTLSLSAYHRSPVTHRQIVVSRPRLIAKHFQISIFLCLGKTDPYVSLPTNSLPSHQFLPAAVSSTLCSHPTSHATFWTSFPNHSSPPLPGCQKKTLCPAFGSTLWFIANSCSKIIMSHN